MTKYYRVRTQEQWDWLMQWFENENENIKWVNGSEKPSNNKIRENIIGNGAIVNVGLYIKLDVYNSISYGYDTEMHTHDYIEVSQMMEDEKMKDYVEIKGEDVEKLKNEQGDSLFFMSDKQHFAYSFIEGFDCSEVNIPKSLLYPKVRMSVAEKKEFDWLKDNAGSLYYALDYIDEERYNRGTIPHLFDAIYGDNAKIKEIVFARVWDDPSLIEVISDRKWKVKVPRSDDSYYFKCEINGKVYLTTVSIEPENTNGALFTDEELKQFGLDDNFFGKVEVSE